MQLVFGFSSSAETTTDIQCIVYARDSYGETTQELNGQNVNIIVQNDEQQYYFGCQFAGDQGMDIRSQYNVEAGTYTIKASAISGYDVEIRVSTDEGEEISDEITVVSDKMAVINVYYTKQQTTSVFGSIVWDDAENEYELRPEYVKVSLLVGGIEKMSATASGEDWSFEFTNLPEFDEKGNEVQYKVEAGIVQGYTKTITGSAFEGYSIVYSYAPPEEGDEAETPSTETNRSFTLTNQKNSNNISVYGRYTDYEKSAPIMSMDVKWDSMEFTYAAKQQGTWDPATHKYKDAVDEADWVNDTSNITVTNHSNLNVTASFEFEAETDYSTVTGNFQYEDSQNSELSVELNAGEENKYDEADSKTVQFVIGGTLNNGVEASTTLGTITVSVDEKTA